MHAGAVRRRGHQRFGLGCLCAAEGSRPRRACVTCPSAGLIRATLRDGRSRIVNDMDSTILIGVGVPEGHAPLHLLPGRAAQGAGESDRHDRAGEQERRLRRRGPARRRETGGIGRGGVSDASAPRRRRGRAPPNSRWPTSSWRRRKRPSRGWSRTSRGRTESSTTSRTSRRTISRNHLRGIHNYASFVLEDYGGQAGRRGSGEARGAAASVPAAGIVHRLAAPVLAPGTHRAGGSRRRT